MRGVIPVSEWGVVLETRVCVDQGDGIRHREAWLDGEQKRPLALGVGFGGANMEAENKSRGPPRRWRGGRVWDYRGGDVRTLQVRELLAALDCTHSQSEYSANKSVSLCINTWGSLSSEVLERSNRELAAKCLRSRNEWPNFAKALLETR